MTDEMIEIARIRGVHGVRGYVLVQPLGEDPASIFDRGPLYDKSGKAYDLTYCHARTNAYVAAIKGVNDRTTAESLRGLVLYVPRAALPALEAGEYYHRDLIGLEARTIDQRAIGTVTGVYNYGAGDLLEVTLIGTKRAELLIFNQQTVPSVSASGRFLTIVPPDNWLEEEPPQQQPSKRSRSRPEKAGA